MKYKEMPLSFIMLLAQNTEALSSFSAMSEANKDRVLSATHDIRSKEEMRKLVNKIADNSIY